MPDFRLLESSFLRASEVATDLRALESYAAAAPAPDVQGTVTTSVNSTTVAKPAGTTIGEKLVVAVYHFDLNTDIAVPTLTGFAQRATYRPLTTGQQIRITVFDRLVDGSEGSSFTASSSSGFVEMACLRLSDAGAFAASVGTTRGTGSTASLPGFTTSVDNTLGLGFYGCWSSANTHSSPPADWTQRAVFDTAQYVYSRAVPTAGVVTDSSITLSGSESEWIALTCSYTP